MKQNDLLAISLLALGGYVVYSQFFAKKAPSLLEQVSGAAQTALTSAALPLGTGAALGTFNIPNPFQIVYETAYGAGQAIGKAILPANGADAKMPEKIAPSTGGISKLAGSIPVVAPGTTVSQLAAMAGQTTPAFNIAYGGQTATIAATKLTAASTSGTALRGGGTAYSYPVAGSTFKGGYWVK